MVWINRLFIFIVGIILTLTTGFGIAAFYPEPMFPQYPIKLSRPLVPESCYTKSESEISDSCKKILEEENKESEKFQMQQQEYNDKASVHTRTTIFLGVVVGALFATIGIFIIKTSPLLSHGFLLAGLLTMIFAKLVVMVASLGSSIKDVNQARNMGYMEFGILVAVSILVVTLGWFKLKEKK